MINDQLNYNNENSLLCLTLIIILIFLRAYVQFRGSEFHTRNARSRQLQEQRKLKPKAELRKDAKTPSIPKS